MAVIRQRIRETDLVTLRDQIGKWPAGTLGAAVDIYDGAALVEIVDDNGRTLDLLTVPNELLDVQGPRAWRSASMEASATAIGPTANRQS